MPPDDHAPPPASANTSPLIARSPVHLLAAMVTLATDQLWDALLLPQHARLPEAQQWPFLLACSTCLLLLAGSSTCLCQRWLAHDSWRAAVAKALALGILAALPFRWGTTEMGMVFMAWSGLNELQKSSR